MKTKKKPVQANIIYTPEEDLYNFMEISSGNIDKGILFRSSSPLKGGDAKKRIEALAVKAGIKCIINLDDKSSVLGNLSRDVSWYNKLFLEDKVLALAMTLSIPGVKSNEKKLKAALQFIINNDGPYLVHCFAGIDRTGFVSALLEMLMGADLKTVCRNYMSAISLDYSFLDTYEYSKMKSLLNQLIKMFHGKDLTTVNIQAETENYLLNNIGLTYEEIIKLKDRLCGGEK